MPRALFQPTSTWRLEGHKVGGEKLNNGTRQLHGGRDAERNTQSSPKENKISIYIISSELFIAGAWSNSY